MIFKLFLELFGNKTHKSTKFVYSMSSCKYKNVNEFNILKYKKGDVFIETDNEELIKCVPSKHLITATEELAMGNMTILFIKSEGEMYLDIRTK